MGGLRHPHCVQCSMFILKGFNNMATRTRNWIFVGYDESLPHNWRDILDDTHIEWVESPLHDRDVNPETLNEETGELECKKPHYHILLLFPSVKTFEQVKELVVGQLWQPIPIVCQSVKGTIRYMVHKDNPEKFQYDWNDIKTHNGADIDSLCKPSMNEINVAMNDIENYISLHKIKEYAKLVDCLRRDGNNDFLSIVRTHTYHFGTYLKSKKYATADDD